MTYLSIWKTDVWLSLNALKSLIKYDWLPELKCLEAVDDVFVMSYMSSTNS